MGDIAERLFRWRAAGAIVGAPHGADFLLPTQVFWCQDPGGSNAPNYVLAEMGLLYAVHGMWDWKRHDTEYHPEADVAALRHRDKRLQPPAANSLFRECSRHGEHYATFATYVGTMHVLLSTLLSGPSYIYFPDLRLDGFTKGGHPVFNIQQIGFANSMVTAGMEEIGTDVGAAVLWVGKLHISINISAVGSMDMSWLLKDMVNCHKHHTLRDVFPRGFTLRAPAELTLAICVGRHLFGRRSLHTVRCQGFVLGFGTRKFAL